MSTHYEVLGISPDATAAAIRKAYLQQCLKHHPDKNPDNIEESKIRFIQIGKAYDVLKDETERQRYDLELLQTNSTTSRSNARRSSSSSSRSSSSANQNTRPPSTEDYRSTSSFASSSYKPSSKETDDLFSSYDDAFDTFVGGLSEQEVQTAMGAAALVGGLIGSVIGGRRGSNLMATAGSIIGSQAGSRMVQSAHQQSIERLQYEDQRQQAVRRGEHVPEKPKGLWASMAKSLGNFVDVSSQNISNANENQRSQSYTQSNSSSSQYTQFRDAAGNLYTQKNVHPRSYSQPVGSSNYTYQTYRASNGQIYTRKVPVSNPQQKSRSYRGGQVQEQGPGGLETAVKVLGAVGALVGAAAAASQNRNDNLRQNNVRQSRRRYS